MKTSIQKKILALSLSGLICCIVIFGGTGIYFVRKSCISNAQRNLDLEVTYAADHISSKFFAVEMYTKGLAAGIMRTFKSVDELQNDSIREAKTAIVQEHINSTIKDQEKAVAVYLRFNPKLAPPTSGIFMAQLRPNGPIESTIPTDFSKYDPEDIEHVGWYYVPIKSEKPMWMEPYQNKNINIYMISYVMPLYINGQEFGVVGMDMDFTALTQKVAQFSYFKSGYSFLETSDQKIIYHPTLPIGSVFQNDGKNTVVRKTMNNGMYLAASTPNKEIQEEYRKLTLQIIIFSLIVLAFFSFISIKLSKTITKPLKKLTFAANKMTQGDMEVEFDTKEKDEIGELATSFATAQTHIKEYLNQVRGLAYKDPLTLVRNKTAYDDYAGIMQKDIRDKKITDFGIMILDLNNLKGINDNYGHEYGNKYLVEACKMICTTFTHSPVFRIGGDEFLVVFKGDDYNNRDSLINVFEKKMQNSMSAKDPWEHISVAYGLAISRDFPDMNMHQMFMKADEKMYEKKRQMKAGC